MIRRYFVDVGSPLGLVHVMSDSRLPLRPYDSARRRSLPLMISLERTRYRTLLTTMVSPIFNLCALRIGPPAALVGENLVAFLSGGVGQPPLITIATTAEGRIVRRLEATRGIVPQSLAASPDGKTIYYVSAGSLFAIGVEGGEPRKLRQCRVSATPGVRWFWKPPW